MLGLVCRYKGGSVLMALTVGAASWLTPPVLGQIACRYEISAIIPGPFCEFWGNAPMFARGLSNHNPPWVAGFYSECTIGPSKAFVWTGSGPAQPLQFPGAGIERSNAFDVTDTGLVVGAFAQSGQPYLGFIYDVATGIWTQLDPAVPGGGVVIRAANNDGMVVGSRNSAGVPYSAFIYQNGVYTDLGIMNGPYSEAWAVSENGIVVGWTGTAIHTNNARGFVHANGVTTILPPLPAGISSTAWAVNSDGEVVGIGGLQLPTGAIRSRAFVWRGQIMTDLGVLPGYRHSGAKAISADGATIVGGCSVLENGSPWNTACIWRDGLITDLNALLPANSPVYLSDAYVVNERGEILCEGNDQSGQVSVVLTPVPAPTGDIDHDCRVSVSDILCVIKDWGKTGSPADLNDDGWVGVPDLLIVINNWTFN